MLNKEAIKLINKIEQKILVILEELNFIKYVFH
jgi:hypothetical protein